MVKHTSEVKIKSLTVTDLERLAKGENPVPGQTLIALAASLDAASRSQQALAALIKDCGIAASAGSGVSFSIE